MSTLTKTFIVLQLVFAIGLAVMVFMSGNQAVAYKGQIQASETARTAAEGTTRQLQTQLATSSAQFDKTANDLRNQISDLNKQLDSRAAELAKAESRRDTLEAQVTGLQNDVQRLTTSLSGLKDVVVAKDQELTNLRPQVAKFTQQNADLGRRNAELANMLDQNEKAIRTLQENIAQMKQPATEAPQTGAATGVQGASVASLSAGAPTAANINGTVTNVQQANGKTYINLSLGSRDGVQVNNRFTIYRGNTYVGDAVVQKVAPDQSVAVVTLNKAPVKADDLVISGAGL